MKAQVNVISVILISGIIISLVGASYMWGAPLVEKRTTVSDFSNAESFMENVEDTVINIVNTGSGKETLDIPTGSLEVIPDASANPDNNSIILKVQVNQPFVFNTTEVYLGDATFEDVVSEIGTYGESSPSVISLTSETSGTGYIIPIKLHFRELDTKSTPKRGYKIALKTGGGKQTGTNSLTLSYDGTEKIPGGAANGGDLILTYILVETS